MALLFFMQEIYTFITISIIIKNYIYIFKNVNIEYIEFFRYNHNIMYLANKKTTIYSSFLVFLIRFSLKNFYILHANLIYHFQINL